MRTFAELFARAGRAPRAFVLLLRRERLTIGARQAVVVAQQEAIGMGHSYVGPEHLLLGLLGGPDTAAAKALQTHGVAAKAVRAEILRRTVPGATSAARRRRPFTPEATKVLELSAAEVLDRHDDAVGAEHLLLGILRHRRNLACEILERLGAEAELVRRTLLASPAAERASAPGV